VVLPVLAETEWSRAQDLAGVQGDSFEAN